MFVVGAWLELCGVKSWAGLWELKCCCYLRAETGNSKDLVVSESHLQLLEGLIAVVF